MNGESEKRNGGIFIPYDKLLQQQSDQLDKLRDEARDLDRRKLDIAVFDSFRISYEQRHEALKTLVQNDKNILQQHANLVPEFRKAQGEIEVLKKDKAEREAVESYKRWWISGAAFGGLLIVINLIINLSQAF